MPLFIIALFGFLISWPIASSALASNQFYNIIDTDDEMLSYDMAIEDKLDYDNWSNETEREARELRFIKAYKDVTKSSTGKNSGLYLVYFIYLE